MKIASPLELLNDSKGRNDKKIEKFKFFTKQKYCCLKYATC